MKKYMLPLLTGLTFLVSIISSVRVYSQCGPYGCPLPSPHSSPQSSGNGQALEPSRYPDIPRVRAGSSVGSCTVFYLDKANNKSYAFTAGHVVPRGGSCIIESGGKSYQGRAIDVHYMIFSDQDAPAFSFDGALIRQITYAQYRWTPEYAVIEIDGILERARAVWDPESGENLVGKEAYVVGWARGSRLQFQRGRITQADSNILVVSCPAIPGQSGGAVLLAEVDQETQQTPLIGIISATDGSRAIATPISFVIARISSAAWLPWRRQQEEIDKLQNRIAELEAELQKYQSGQIAPPNAQPNPEVEKRVAAIEVELKTLREQLATHQKAIESLVASVKELGGKVEQLPINVPPPPPQPAPQPQPQPEAKPQPQPVPPANGEWEEFKREWTWVSRGWVIATVGIGIWLLILTIRGRGFVFSSPIAKLVTRIIPGQVDDVIVTLLALGEDKLAGLLGRIFGRSPSAIADLQRKVADTIELIDKLNLKKNNNTKKNSK